MVHVLGSSGPEARGIARTVANVASAADSNCYRFSVIAFRNDGAVATWLRSAGVTVKVVNWHGGHMDIRGAMRFARALQMLNPDVVHLHAGGISPRIVSRIAAGAHVIVHYHSLSEESRATKKSRRTPLGADLIIANSRATAASVKGAAPLVVYPGIQVPPAKVRPSDDTVVLGIAARLAPIKGITHLIDAMALLNGSHPHIRLEIAGDGTERKPLETIVREKDLENHVTFSGWADNIASIMAEWDIYVQPSLAEGLGIAVLEAMAIGLPVIASNVGGLPEIVIDNETGYLVPVGDPRILADRIIQLASDPQLRRRMGDAARARVTEFFRLETEARTIISAYDQILT